MDRRKFLTVVGATVAARSRSPAVPPAGSRSWCRTWCSRRIRSPASPPGTPAPAPSATPAAACTCGRARAAPSSSRAIPSIPSIRASSAPAARPRCRGCTIRAASRPRCCAAPTAGSARSPGTTRSRRLAGKLTEAGGKVAVLSGAGRGTFSDLLAEWTRRWADGWSAGARSTTSRCARPIARCSASTSCRRTTSAAPSTSCRSAPTSSTRGSRRPRTSAASPTRTASPTADVAKFVYAGAADGPHRSQRRRVARDASRHGDGPRARHGERRRRPPRRARRRWPRALARFTPAMAAQETGIPAERIERIAKEFAAAQPSLAVAGGIGAQHAGAAELCAAVNLLNYVAGNIGQTVRFGAELDGGDGYAALGPPRRGDRRRPGRRAAGARRQPGLRAAQGRGVRRAAREGAVQGRDRALPRRDGRAVRPAAAAAPRARALGRSRAAVRGAEPHAAGDGAGVQHPRRRATSCSRCPRKAGGALAGFTAPTWEAHLRGRWQALAAERKGADAEGFWRAALQRGGVFDEPAAPAPVALAARPPTSPTPSPRSRGRVSSSSSPTRTRTCTTAAAPTSPGCSRTPIPSPRSPGTRGWR